MGRCSRFAHCPRFVWGGARVSRTVPVCAGWSGCFVGSLTCSFELLPAHAQDAPVVAPAPRVRRARLPPCEVCVHSASSHAGQVHSPRVAGYVPPRRPRAFCPRVRFAAARVVELVGASHEGDTHSPVAASVLWAKRRHRRWATSPRRCICPPRHLRAASSRPRLHHPVHITVEAAGLCRLPPKTWRCDGVSLNCRCSAVLFEKISCLFTQNGLWDQRWRRPSE